MGVRTGPPGITGAPYITPGGIPISPVTKNRGQNATVTDQIKLIFEYCHLSLTNKQTVITVVYLCKCNKKAVSSSAGYYQLILKYQPCN